MNTEEASMAKKDKLCPLRDGWTVGDQDKWMEELERLIEQKKMEDMQKDQNIPDPQDAPDGDQPRDQTEDDNQFDDIDTRKNTISAKIKSLNTEQRKVCEHVLQWCINDRNNIDTEPLRIFLTGGVGTGKSYLLQVLVEMINIIYFDSFNPRAVYTEILAPTGVAATLIGGKHYILA